MTHGTPGIPTAMGWGPRTAWLAGLAATVTIVIVAACYALFAVRAVTFPFGVDYAEGEVWQQANLITGSRAYGDIQIAPFIGFEYPPLYHLIALAVARVSPDFLMAGRIVSVSSTMLSAAAVALLAASFGRGLRPPAARAFGGVIAAGLILTLQPIETFSTLARVDMLQVAFSLTGMVFAVSSLRRPGHLIMAVFLFVCAGFTKQTALAAPIAAFAVMIVRSPRHTLAAYAAGAILTGCLIAILELRTGGGFLRHIIVYNVNRYSFPHFLAFLVYVGAQSLPLWGLVILAVCVLWAAHFRRHDRHVPALDLRASAEAAQLALLSLYLALTAGSTLLDGKAGSSVNYFLEFLCCCCVWTGALAAFAVQGNGAASAKPPFFRTVLAVAVPAAIILQCLPSPSYLYSTAAKQFGPAARAVSTALLQRLTGMDKPVLSDDMAIVMQAGKTPPIEPYIFAELAAAGLWDEQNLVSLINARAFAAVLTFQGPGNIVFDDRFQPKTVAAILANYPVVANYGDDRLRLPK